MSTLLALTVTEVKLYAREWGTLVFAFVFPPVMMLILAGVFAADTGGPFGPVNGSDHYIVSYLAIPLAAVALTTLPVMMAGYAEAGILKRYAASGVGPLRVVVAQALTCMLSVVAGAVVVLAVAAPVYGIPAIERPWQTVGVVALGVPMMLTLGVALGLFFRSVRVANAIGLTIFFPVFILGGGGPPAGVMTSAMRDIADVLPLTHLTNALRQAWLLDGVAAEEIWWIVGWWAAAAVVAVAAIRWRRD